MAELKSTRPKPPRSDLTGKRFGKLTVARWAGNSSWLCVCDCGKQHTVATGPLNRGNTRSCGCLKPTVASKRATKHGLSKTLAYRTWLSIRRRCRDKTNTGFKTYGARGIDMHQAWYESFQAFFDAVGHPPTPAHTMDRIDNSLGYFPGNVRWATPTEQARNRSVCRKIEFQGATYPSISAFVEWLAPQIGANPRSLTRELQSAFRSRPKRVATSATV